MSQSASTLIPLVVALRDLAIAPENPRFREGPDPQIPDLADSLSPEAAGLLVPLLVRRGNGKKESPFMVVDGRRRLLALHHLLESGIVGEDLEVAAQLCESQEAIAAAAIAANQQRLPLHPGDIILAIKAMAEKKFSLDRIAKALCTDLAEIRKYAIVAKVHIDAITAFKEKLFDYSVLKLIARIPSKSEQQKLVALGREQGSLWAGQVQDYLENDGLSENSTLMQFVGKSAYLAAGGRTISDLLNEMPDVCLDAQLAATLWCEKLAPIQAHYKAAGLDVFVAPDESCGRPDGLATAPYRYNRPKDEGEAIAAAQTELDDARLSLRESADLSALTAEDLLPLLDPHLALARAKFAPLPIRAVQILPGKDVVVQFSFFTTYADIRAWEAEKEALQPQIPEPPSKSSDKVPPRAVSVDTDHANAFHRHATEIAVRGFQRSLADSFPAAFKLAVSTMFVQVVLHRPGLTADDRALQVSYDRNIQGWKHTPVEGLDHDLTARLLAYRDRFAETGLRPYPWVSRLTFPELQDMLALMTAANVWISEDDTRRLRTEARAQIQEIADEIDHDIRHHWYPDASFYGKCSKKQLLGYAERMGCEIETLGTLKKGALADYVAEQGVARQWVPPVLSFANMPETTSADDLDELPEADGDPEQASEEEVDEDEPVEVRDEGEPDLTPEDIAA